MSAASYLRVNSMAESVAVARDFGGREPAITQAPPARKHRVSAATMALCAACCLALGLGFVAQKARLMIHTHRLAALQSELAALERERGYLQLAVMNARSPEYIERQARERLGMTKPERVEFLVLVPTATQGQPQGTEEGDGEEAAIAPGMVATMGKWLTDNWPRWGRAEASHRQ